MKSGDVQWMKTGSGIIHSEMPAMSQGRLHGFQLWVNMPAKEKMSKPDYIYIDSKKMQIFEDSDKIVKVIAGKFENAEGQIIGHSVEPIYFDIKLEKDNNSSIIEIHNRPLVFTYLSKRIDSKFILYFHNDPLTMTGSKSISERKFLLKNTSKIVQKCI